MFIFGERVIFIKALRMVIITVIMGILATGCSSKTQNIPNIEISINQYIEMFNLGVNSNEDVKSSLIDVSTVEETDISDGEFAGLKCFKYTNAENIVFNFYADDTDSNINKLEVIFDGNTQTNDQLTLFYAYVYLSMYIIENYDILMNGDGQVSDIADRIYKELDSESGEFVSGDKAQYSLSWGDGSESFVFTFNAMPLE